MNKLDHLFSYKKERVLNVYCTAGYPKLDSTTEVILSLQKNGADIIEVGMPYSDPIADGPTIQQSNMQALANGITIEKLFSQLNSIKNEVNIPLILMGYLNPVMQYGIERFCQDAAAAGISGVILPDLPMYEYEHLYKPMFEKNGLHLIFLVTPETSADRIKKADKFSNGFLYAVSSSSTTGNNTTLESQEAYFEELQHSNLRNPVLIGFGIKDKITFDLACKYAAGAIIGSAYIKALSENNNINEATAAFIHAVKHG